MKAKIKKSDKVIILAGKDKGKIGDISRIFLRERKVIVTGVNAVKKATKPSKKNLGGGLIEINKPIDISNVAFICPSCGKPTRIGLKMTKGGQKERICKVCKTTVKE
jgi:large subunit ribosomal protein L24